MIGMRYRAILLVLSGTFFLCWGSRVDCAEENGPIIQATVDARELSRRLLHTSLKVPCQSGKLRLWYPKWIPGTHGPNGHVEDIGGLRIESANGKAIPWQRDDINLHCILCEIPGGISEVEVKLDTICNGTSATGTGAYSNGNASLGVINWNTCMLYPEGPASRAIGVQLTLQIPESWHYATALKTENHKPGEVAFKKVSLEELIDSPLITGQHLRSIKLDSGNNPPAYLHLVSEASSALQLDQKVIDSYGRLVREACALFGAAHYPEYHFLVVCSNEMGQFGLEHHACSLNGVGERSLIEDRNRRGWIANLLPHEYVHSWCGKFRRPAGMCVPDFHTPQKTKLLWVYEGLTQYLGDVLMVRSGLVSSSEYREMLAWTISNQRSGDGKRWRSLEDTAVSSYLLRSRSPHWNELRRDQDYYPEGGLLWMEVDAIIREKSEGKRSLDDFCKRFLGPISAQTRVVPYELSEIIGILKELADFDWEAFFQRRVATPQESLPTDLVALLGYRLNFSGKPSGYGEFRQSVDGRPANVVERDSIGLTFSPDGKITGIVPGLAGDRAKLAQGMQVLAINGRKFSRDRLQDALLDSVARRKIDLLIVEGDLFRSVVLEYGEGPRYLELVRKEGKPDYFMDIMKSLTNIKPPGSTSPPPGKTQNRSS